MFHATITVDAKTTPRLTPAVDNDHPDGPRAMIALCDVIHPTGSATVFVVGTSVHVERLADHLAGIADTMRARGL